MNIRPRRLPAEWEPQDAVLLTWPHARTDWAGELAAAERTFLEIAAQVGARQRVLIACHDEPLRKAVARALADRGLPPERWSLYLAPSNDTWARDHGPLGVIADGRPLLLDFEFNGWGGKFEAALDNRISRELQRQGAFGATPLQRIDLVLEGGAIDSDGAGTILTTASCLLAAGRNAGIERADWEELLARHLGAARVLWLEHGALQGDDTDGHIDTLARFCDARTIAHVSCPDRDDDHHETLAAMETQLRTLRTAEGKPYRLIPLPWPRAQRDAEGRRLPATYANFLIINGAVLVPTYRDPSDAEALRLLRECFPRREVVGIDCSALIRQNGSLHCVTMQIPAGVLAPVGKRAAPL